MARQVPKVEVGLERDSSWVWWDFPGLELQEVDTNTICPWGQLYKKDTLLFVFEKIRVCDVLRSNTLEIQHGQKRRRRAVGRGGQRGVSLLVYIRHCRSPRRTISICWIVVAVIPRSSHAEPSTIFLLRWSFSRYRWRSAITAFSCIKCSEFRH